MTLSSDDAIREIEIADAMQVRRPESVSREERYLRAIAISTWIIASQQERYEAEAYEPAPERAADDE